MVMFTHHKMISKLILIKLLGGNESQDWGTVDLHIRDRLDIGLGSGNLSCLSVKQQPQIGNQDWNATRKQFITNASGLVKNYTNNIIWTVEKLHCLCSEWLAEKFERKRGTCWPFVVQQVQTKYSELSWYSIVYLISHWLAKPKPTLTMLTISWSLD